MTDPVALPIEAVLPQVVAALHHHSSVVLQAPPGAGKTTRVPLALLTAPFLQGQKIIMLEPRRLAAVNAARWMAAQLKEEVGQTVGYSIRFERQVSAATRIEVVTEGILARRLQTDQALAGVVVVIFDEFHERSLNTDLALALCRDVQLGLREELKILVMSATLDGGPVATLLGEAPVVSSAGRSYPVEIRYLGEEGEADIARATARGIELALRETSGDILAFLPGAGEIRRCLKLLQEGGGAASVLISPLYGDLPFAAQQQAILPAGRRKVVLATNIAETSLTIEGVRVVVDSGWSRQALFDPASGLNRLATVRVSAASAEQRTGRAGRLGPGVCYRLWSVYTQRSLVPFTAPEIRNSDLTPLALELAQWGISDANSLSWLDPPPVAALAEGRRLLTRLGALDPQGKITPQGRAMAALPIHPRLSHLLLLAQRLGTGAIGCDLAALLAERDIFRSAAGSAKPQLSDSDLLDRLEALACWRRGGADGQGQGQVDPAACRAVDKVAGYWRHHLGGNDRQGGANAELIGRLLAAAYPDRIGQQREPASARYLLANGRGASLSPRCSVRDAPYLVAASVEGGERSEGVIHLASALSLASLRTEFAAQLEWRRLVRWDSREGRVVAKEEERFGALVLAVRQVKPSAQELVTALVSGLTAPDGPGLTPLNWSLAALQLQARVQFLARTFPEETWPDFSSRQLLATLGDWLGPSLAGINSLSSLAAVDLVAPLKGMLSWEQQRKLEELAPTHVTVPSGSRLALSYSADEPPHLAVKLQEMFGLADTPKVARGRVVVVLHLLSPARQPIQVTRDLKGFWNGAYLEVKKELKGRYPKHPWPEDPWSAVATKGTKKSEARKTGERKG